MIIKLKEFRDAYGYSQQDLASALSVSQSAVSRMEAVGSELSGPQIEKLCAKFGKEKVMTFVYSSTDASELAKKAGIPTELSPLQVINILKETIQLQKDNMEAQQKIITAQAKLIEEYKKVIEDLTERQ